MPKKTDFVFTSYGQYYDEFFKIYLANLIKTNPKTKLSILQHGYGNMFIQDDFYNLFLDRKISNIFLAWGDIKKNKNYSFCYPLSRNKNKINFSVNKKILILSYSFSYTLHTPPDGTINGIDIDKIILFKMKNFLKNINLNIKNKINFKSQVINKFNNFDYNLKKNFKINILDSRLKFLKIKNNFNLIIHTFIGTSFFECLVYNIPCVVIFSEKCHLPFDHRFKSYINMLKKINIIFENENEASEFINKNYSKIEKWWNSEEVKKIVKNITNDYCNNKKDPVILFKKIINNK